MPDPQSSRHRHHRHHSRHRSSRRTARRYLPPVIAALLLLAAFAIWTFVLEKDTRLAAHLDESTEIANTPPLDRQSLNKGLTLVKLPADDAAHQESMERWTYRGLLQADTGQRFGYQLSVFRHREVVDYTVFHVSIVDLQTGKSYSGQARTPGVPNRVEQDGFDFQHENWIVSGSGPKHRVEVRMREFALILALEDARPPVLHQAPNSGGPGLLDLGGADKLYYYSRMRVPTRGSITVNGNTLPVSGQSWFDHQWGDLHGTQPGWNWLALHLDDGTDVVAFDVIGSRERQLMHVATVNRQGTTTAFGNTDYTLRPLDKVETIPGAPVRYPQKWELAIPGKGLLLQITAPVEHCAFDRTETGHNRTWEGPVLVSGSDTGVGYLELSGYGGAARR